MTEIQEKTALIDSLEIGNINILQLNNIEELVQKEIIEISTTKAKYITASGQQFSRLKIENDRLIDRMVAGSKIMKNRRIDYCTMSLSIKNDELGNLACYTALEYFDLLVKIQNHLEKAYGIVADFSDVTLKVVEINRTFRLNNNFEGYHRVLNLIMTNLPSYLKNQMDYKKIDKNGISTYETYYATSQRTNKSKRYLRFKIYDKSAAIKNIIMVTDSFMRVEITLVSPERIKKSFGTNKFVDISDKVINDFFDNQIQKMIVKPLKKWAENRDKYLLNLMQGERSRDIRHWQTNVLRILQNREISEKRPTLLDIEELIHLLDGLGLRPNRKWDVKKNFRKQAQKFESIFCNRDDLRLVEIIEKLTSTEMITTAKNTNIGGISKVA